MNLVARCFSILLQSHRTEYRDRQNIECFRDWQISVLHILDGRWKFVISTPIILQETMKNLALRAATFIDGTAHTETFRCAGTGKELQTTCIAMTRATPPDDISDFLDAGSFSCATTGVSRRPGCRGGGRGGSSCLRDPDDCKAGGALSWDQAGGDALRDQLPVLIADLTGAVDPNASG